MALEFSTTVANGLLDQLEVLVGTAPILRIYTGSAPGIDEATTGTLLAEMTLPSDWASPASGRAKTKSGTWQDASANASGDAGYFRMWKSDGTTLCMEGTAGAQGTSVDLPLLVNGVADATITLGDIVSVETFSMATGNHN